MADRLFLPVTAVIQKQEAVGLPDPMQPELTDRFCAATEYSHLSASSQDRGQAQKQLIDQVEFVQLTKQRRPTLAQNNSQGIFFV